jgi:HD-GYP domain-containing protein (c-di-GMP phosphodiesterase class II)
MDFSKKLLLENQRRADRTLVIVGQIVAILNAFIGFLNMIGVFVIESHLFSFAIILSMFISILPTILFVFLKKKGNWTVYLILTTYTIMVGLMYAVVSYHAIIMFVFPIVCSCLYSNQKWVIYTLIITIPTVILSHLAAFYLKIVPDEPLVTLHGVIVYGILPRLIQILAIGIICIGITGRLNRVIRILMKKNNDLYINQQMLISSLSELIETQSQETGQHVKRVSEYTKIICNGLGLDDETTWKVSIASMMHDVGKIMVPNEIIEKKGKLTEDEFKQVKLHVEYGKKMLENSPGEIMQISATIAYLHHEKWDGTGYHNIKGEDIPLFARIVSLTDVFDALVSARPYKAAWTKEEAYHEIVNQSGKQFDPKIVGVFQSRFQDFVRIMEKYPDSEKIELKDIIKDIN